MPRHSRRKKKPGSYSKGELNRLIDSLLHPLFDQDPVYVMTDTILHGLIEQNPPETAAKFIHYNLPKLLRKSQTSKKQ